VIGRLAPAIGAGGRAGGQRPAGRRRRWVHRSAAAAGAGAVGWVFELVEVGWSGVGGVRTHTVSVRLSPGEYAVWVAAARSVGRGQLGAWVRDRVAGTLPAMWAAPGAGAGWTGGSVAVEGPGRRPLAVGLVASGEWASLRGELSRVGNNLNQAVRVANSAVSVDAAGVAALAGAVGWVETLMAELLTVLRAVGADAGAVYPDPVVARSLAEQVSAGIAARAAERQARAVAPPTAAGVWPPVKRRRSPTARAVAAAERAAGRAAVAAPAGRAVPPAGGGVR